MNVPPIDLVRIEAIAHVVANLGDALPAFESLLGFRVAERGQTDAGDAFAWLVPPGVSGVDWLLLAPGTDDSALAAFLAGPRGPGIHHLRIAVATTDRVRSALPAADGVAWTGPRPSGERVVVDEAAGWGVRFELHDGSARSTRPGDDPGADTLGIIAINHVAHAHPDRDALGAWYEETWGFTTFWRSPEGRRGPSGDFATRVLDAPTKQMRIEAIQPTRPESFIQKFLDERGPAPHHVTVEVADWQRAMGALEGHGVPFFGHRDSETDGVPWSEAFIHPRHTHGVLFQFFWQAEPGVWI